MTSHPQIQYRQLVFAAVSLTIVSFANSAMSQDWAKVRLEKSPRHLEYATVKYGNREVNCFVAYPEVSRKAPAVVIIHDISGFGDWIRGVCDQLAEAGYVAIVPDLLSEMGPDKGGTESFKSIDDARRAVSKLKADQVTADLNAVCDYAGKLPAATGSVSVAGFCWGGGQCLRYATNNDRIRAAFVFYGYEPVDAESIARVKCSVYGFYAENDARIGESIPGVTKLMSAAHKTYEPVIYKGAGHGFMRQGEDPAGTEANKRAREDAWLRWKKLLKTIP
jgi:carboxymethylenebutenolidase